MQHLLEDSDTDHIIDLSLHKDNPIYARLELVESKGQDGVQKWELIPNQVERNTIVWENSLKLLRESPSDFLVITGIAPNWVRTLFHGLAQQAAAVLYTSDGKNIMLLPKLPPRARARLFFP
jgi:hypothetical protein